MAGSQAIDALVTGIAGTFGVLAQAAQNSTGAIVQPMSNFYMEIDQGWPYRAAWVERMSQVGLAAKLNPTFFDTDGGFSESVGVNYADTQVIGRPEQYKQYTGTNNRELAVTFHFQAQGAPSGGATAQTLAGWLRSEVQNPVRWLDSLRFPFIETIGNDRISHAPPPIMLWIGELIAMRCLLTEAQITWKPPFDPVTLLPYAADVSCTFTAITQNVANYGFTGPSRWAN